MDVAIEFQTHERVAAIVSSRLVQAGIPVIALEVPHPGAVYFGANNYQAGQMGGRAIARWARKHWESEAEEIVLLKESQSGPLPKLRLTGMLHGLREELPALERTPVTELDGKGLFAPAHDVIRRHVRRAPNRRTLVLAHNDLMALGAIRGFEEAGRGGQCGVVGQNAIPEAREELRRPGTPLIGTVAYFPEQYGDRVIPLALALAAGKNPPAAQYTKHVLLTPGNVNEVYPVDLELPAGYQDHSVNPLSG